MFMQKRKLGNLAKRQKMSKIRYCKFLLIVLLNTLGDIFLKILLLVFFAFLIYICYLFENNLDVLLTKVIISENNGGGPGLGSSGSSGLGGDN